MSLNGPREPNPWEGLDKLDQGSVGNLIDLDVDDTSTADQQRTPTSPALHLQPSLLDLEDPVHSIDSGYENLAATQAQNPEECEQCGSADRDASFCNGCDAVFCAECWEGQFQHKRQRAGRGGVPHEKTPASVAQKVQNVLKPPVESSVREQLHIRDADAAWFGIFRPEDGPPLFQDYGRFTTLMNVTEENSTRPYEGSGQGLTRDTRTPSLVSFVGETGAGKSTLIKLLIDLNMESHENYTTPVVGAAGSDVPTSEDVHLYLEPRTAYTPTPVLFADCEGLTGGTREPIGALIKKAARRKVNAEGTGTNEQLSHKERPISEREITWAENPRTKSREFAVTNLYPRLLYTFSDVVVFVLREARVMESVLERLVEWAVAALEMSSNQPVLPHAIIVLNASSNDIDPSLWDPETATKTIFANLRGTLNHNRVFKRQAQIWRERGQQIESLEELMLSWYSSINIIRVPEKGRPTLIQNQVQKLYDSICDACSWSRDSRSQLRMLLEVEELQSYLDCAFDHYAHTLDRPFDFVQASLANSPIPLDFGGNILKLAINVMQVWKDQAHARTIFQELSYMVASCIMFDLARNKNKGTVESIFPLYLDHLDAALENFCNSHWPCEYVKPGTGTRCVNVRSGHAKGHQREDGKVLAVGEYISTFSYQNDHEVFHDNVFHNLKDLQGLLHRQMLENDPEEIAVSKIHRDTVLSNFFRRCTRGDMAAHFHSHTACFCCLFELPQYCLPCGHIICASCARIYGSFESKTELTVPECPLCNASRPCKIHLKPKKAGIRVLTLDGGGMRGIVELEILRSIERALGDKLPIQNFFDLIVGTSTGGWIALGLAAQGWSVQECLNHFEQICRDAFTPRTAEGLFGVSWLVNNYRNSRYDTSPLENALTQAFGEKEYLFGRSGTTQWTGIKVAVTSTSAATGTAVVLSNYNRSCSEKLSYHFQRPENLDSELKLWETARATSAAPGYFTSFNHEASKQVYLDGETYHNNPIDVAERERKLIWPDQPSESADVILSLGTGSSLRHRQGASRSSPIPKRSQPGLLPSGLGRRRVSRDRDMKTLDCDKAWEQFMSDLPYSWEYSRFVRINPEPPVLPHLDQVAQMKELQDSVNHMLLSQEQSLAIRRIAMRLAATSFFFELRKPVSEDRVVSGLIQCRLANKSREVCELGRLIKSWAPFDRPPFFLVQRSGQRSGPEDLKLQQVVISEEILEKMIVHYEFRAPSVKLELSPTDDLTDVRLCFSGSETFPISGFPRSLLEETVKSRGGSQREKAGASSRRNRWVTQLHEGRRKKWTPPASVDAQPQPASLSNYAQSSNALGHASIDELVEMAHNLKYGANQSSETPSNTDPNTSALANLRGALRGLVHRVKSQSECHSTEEVNQQEPAVSEQSSNASAHPDYSAAIVAPGLHELEASHSLATELPTEIIASELDGREVERTPERANDSNTHSFPPAPARYRGESCEKSE